MKRPSQDFFSNGSYSATIKEVHETTTDRSDLLHIQLVMKNEEGLNQEEVIRIVPDWKPGSVFRMLLDATDTLPDLGKDLQLEQLREKEIFITIVNQSRSGRIFTNLVHVESVEDE